LRSSQNSNEKRGAVSSVDFPCFVHFVNLCLIGSTSCGLRGIQYFSSDRKVDVDDERVKVKHQTEHRVACRLLVSVTPTSISYHPNTNTLMMHTHYYDAHTLFFRHSIDGRRTTFEMCGHALIGPCESRRLALRGRSSPWFGTQAGVG
jgi:hypothetical protein